MKPSDAKYGTPVQHPDWGRGIVVWHAMCTSVLLHGSVGPFGSFIHIISDDLPLEDVGGVTPTRWSEWEPWDGPDQPAVREG